MRQDGYQKLWKAARITAFQPHMHTRGRAQCLELIYPDASTEVVNCAHYNYNWHLIYSYTDDTALLVPASTLLHVMTWHDNTAANRANPDPKNWVGDGERTIDEMGFAWIGWYDLTDDEYKQEWAASKALRQQKTSATTGGQQHQQQSSSREALLQATACSRAPAFLISVRLHQVDLHEADVRPNGLRDHAVRAEAVRRGRTRPPSRSQ